MNLSGVKYDQTFFCEYLGGVAWNCSGCRCRSGDGLSYTVYWQGILDGSCSRSSCQRLESRRWISRQACLVHFFSKVKELFSHNQRSWWKFLICCNSFSPGFCYHYSELHAPLLNKFSIILSGSLAFRGRHVLLLLLLLIRSFSYSLRLVAEVTNG